MSECHRCGKPATVSCPNPFLSEVYPEDGPYADEDWCEECLESCRDDI